MRGAEPGVWPSATVVCARGLSHWRVRHMVLFSKRTGRSSCWSLSRLNGAICPTSSEGELDTLFVDARLARATGAPHVAAHFDGCRRALG